MISHTLVNHQSNGFLVVDPLDHVVLYSREAERLLNLPASESRELPLTSLPPNLQSFIAKARRPESTVTSQDMAIAHHGDEPGHITLRVDALRFRDQNSTSLLLTLKDMSSLQILEDKMRTLERLASIGTLTSCIAHEIKNAIQPANTFVDTLINKANSSQLLQGADEQQLMLLASQELKRITNLLGNMLGFVRKERPPYKLLQTGDVLRQALALVRYLLEGKPISLVTKLDADQDGILGDSNQLEQAFLNIMLNAIEATPPGGQITLFTRQHPDRSPDGEAGQLEIVFEDTGSGIAPENSSRLFETFFTTKETGTGLGLGITQRILHEHGGNISIQSQLHTGTRVTVLLPLAPAQTK